MKLAHKMVMDTVMKYVIGMPKCGLALKPNAVWDRTKDLKFAVSGRSDSEYAKFPDTRKSVSG